MRKPIAAILVLVSGLALAACGSSGSPESSSTIAPTTTSANEFSSAEYDKAGPNPSISAKMVCQPEAREDIAANLGIKQKRVTAPKWDRAQHLYSCTYVYPRGKITLYVKELSSVKETTDYFNGLRRKYGETQQLNGLGQGAWILKNNDVVVRKDYKVLLVDVEGIPADFAPSMTRSDVALNIGVAIMGCWVGA